MYSGLSLPTPTGGKRRAKAQHTTSREPPAVLLRIYERSRSRRSRGACDRLWHFCCRRHFSHAMEPKAASRKCSRDGFPRARVVVLLSRERFCRKRRREERL